MVHANYPLEKTVHHSGGKYFKMSHEPSSYENPKSLNSQYWNMRQF